MPRYIITINNSSDRVALQNPDVTTLADYGDTILVEAPESAGQKLKNAGIEMTLTDSPQIHVGGRQFGFTAAAAAPDTTDPSMAPGRRQYFLINLVGPPQSAWLERIRAVGGDVQGSLAADTLIVGGIPQDIQGLKEPWIEGISLYRASLKVDHSLTEVQGGGAGVLGIAAPSDKKQQIEVSVFRGETTTLVEQALKDEGATVLRVTPRSVIAIASDSAIGKVASMAEVQAVQPHSFPKFSNDKARNIMGISDIPTPCGTMGGQDQIVAIADSGLDTGDTATIHADFAGRVVGITSFPAPTDFAPFVHDAPGSDDGASDLFSGHGTHVAGSVLGDGSAAVNAGGTTIPAGAARQAKLFFQAVEQQINWKTRAELAAEGNDPGQDWPPPSSGLFGLPDDLKALFDPAYDAGARIHTNSWGSNEAGKYTANSRQVDSFMFDHRDILILFAAGNEGVDDDRDGFIDTGSIGPPATAKNCLAVGASENERPSGSAPVPGIDREWRQLNGFTTLTQAGHVSDNRDGMAGFSSRGPTNEGRIKPDVVAPGTNILSTRSSVFTDPDRNGILWGDLQQNDALFGLYCWSGGTSMATPLVAGLAAVVRQYLVTCRGHFEDRSKPSGALIKAMIINLARPMGGQFPSEVPAGVNPVSGFGRVDISRIQNGEADTIQFADEPADAVSTGQIRRYTMTPHDANASSQITLAWSDAPSIVSNGSLENRLYLQVRMNDGTVIDGDLTAFPNATNNVQQLVIPNPAEIAEIRVRGVAVSRHAPGVPGTALPPRQDFALVVSNADSLTLPPSV